MVVLCPPARQQHRNRYIVRVTVLLLLLCCCWISIYGPSVNRFESAQNGIQLLKQNETTDNDETAPDIQTEEEVVTVPPFWANQAFESYKQQHSQQALLAETSHIHRKYAVVFYWCPERAGNIMHNLFNSMTWAMITNRTILWAYDTYSNTEKDCEQVLKRASWLASWDEWSVKLQLRDPVPIPIDLNRIEYDAQHETVIFPQIPDLLSGDPTIFRNHWRYDPLNFPEYKYYINSMNRASKVKAGMLWYEGVNYLFGMLFRECFTFQSKVDGDSLTRTMPPSKQAASPFSIALHSRHPVVGDDGTYLEEEMNCLTDLIAAYKEETSHISMVDGNGSCQVYLMSDRPITIDILSRWIVEHNCTPISVDHNDAGGRTEHGPWAGVGFLEDLTVASLARNAVVGDFHRSSFMLLVELIEYDRKIEAWEAGLETVADLKACSLREKPSSGYNYGPGTPTFRHHSLQAPLSPINVTEQYIKWHSVSALSSPVQGRRFVRVFYSCSSAFQDGSILGHQFLSGLLWAITSNRTLLFENNQDCDSILVQREWMPSYKEWSSQLQLDGAVDLMFDRQQDIADIQVVSFPRNLTRINDFSTLYYLLPTEGLSRATAKMLYSQGTEFLWGMLFDYSFELSSLAQSGIPDGFSSNSSFQTIALNSHRKSSSSNEMEDISDKIECLETVLTRNQVGVSQNDQSCHVYVMDENETMSQLSAWLVARNCSVWRANHHSMEAESKEGINSSSKLLHYFQDLSLLSKARSAYIGYDPDATDKSSTSSLILELIEFNRRKEAWKRGRDPPLLPSFSVCFLPEGH